MRSRKIIGSEIPIMGISEIKGSDGMINSLKRRGLSRIKKLVK